MRRVPLLALVLLAACIPAPNESLRAKIALGCTTTLACEEMVAEAEQLKRSCYDYKGAIGYSCAVAGADLEAARQVRGRYLDEAAARDRATKAALEAQARAQADADAKYRAEREAWQARQDELQREAERVAEAARERKRLEERCEAQRQKRAEIEKRRVEAAEREKKQAEAIAWVVKRCPLKREPVFEMVPWVDKAGFIRVTRRIVDWDEFYLCPSSIPAEIRDAAPLDTDDRGRLTMDPAYAEPKEPGPPSDPATRAALDAAAGFDPRCHDIAPP